MRTEFCRYTPEMFQALGLNPDARQFHVMTVTEEDLQRQRLFAYGDFEAIIKTLFDNPDARPGFDNLLSENSAPEIVSFVNNFLMKEIQTIPPMQSDEDAFASIIPRSVQTEGELRPYLDNLKKFISENRPKPQTDVTSEQPSTSE